MEATRKGPLPARVVVREQVRLSRSSVPRWDIRSDFAERFWLPTLGPTSMFMARRFARGLAEHPGGFSTELSVSARSVGLGGGLGGNAPFARSLNRLTQFGVAGWSGEEFEVSRSVGLLPDRLVARLPEPLARQHEAIASADRWAGYDDAAGLVRGLTAAGWDRARVEDHLRVSGVELGVVDAVMTCPPEWTPADTGAERQLAVARS